MHNSPFLQPGAFVVDHLDSSVLATLQDVMEAEYPVLLDTFLTDSEERLLLLQSACRNGDGEDLRQAAHSFKGSCSNMGATLLAELCRELEETARVEQLDEAPELIERIEREFAIVRILYRAERQRAGGSG
ncbi:MULTISPECIES: Hpt domain-containing protein [unclassified Pseudomonas]|uniref:Hpt domain-containing protein n=1 Tax=unclassified Pseudomonas TaxID=196821 RepID=UPI000E073A17|nr:MULTISPECIES: Hpt domain-containing protein [unclassified Pseudomonas]NKQ11853.1 Hpt domain-containing protein [Pseudomonas sp. SST3]